MYINGLILRLNSFRQIVIQPNYLSCQKLVLREQYPGINCNAIQTRNFSLDEILVGNEIPFFAARKNPLGVKFI